MQELSSRNAGFTLVEMIAVIVLLSFGLIGGSQLFRITAESYRETSTRLKLTQDGRFVIERLSRELRQALPGSVRESTNATTNTQCLEWLPIIAASRYLSLPTTSPSNHFTVMEIDPDVAGSNLYAEIFPVGTGAVYLVPPAAGAGGALVLLSSTPMNASGESDTNTDEIYLNAARTFTAASASDRVFITTTPVAVCVQSDGRMLRHSNYDFVADATTLTGGTLLAENVLGGTTVDVFDFSDATLTRNAMVGLNIRIRDPNTEEVIRLQHTAFIRNVP
jgi:MSHA biogenesis protein MshO